MRRRLMIFLAAGIVTAGTLFFAATQQGWFTTPDDRGPLWADMKAVFEESGLLIVIEEEVVDEEFKDQVLFSLLRDGASSERHGDMFRALNGPFDDAKTYWITLDDPEYFPGGNGSPSFMALVVDDRVKMASVDGYLAAPSFNGAVRFEEWRKVALSALVLLSGNEIFEDVLEKMMDDLRSGKLKRARPEIAGDHSLVAEDDRTIGNISVWAQLFFTFGATDASPRYYVWMSAIADRCPPKMDEPTFYARYICGAGLKDIVPDDA